MSTLAYFSGFNCCFVLCLQNYMIHGILVLIAAFVDILPYTSPFRGRGLIHKSYIVLVDEMKRN